MSQDSKAPPRPRWNRSLGRLNRSEGQSPRLHHTELFDQNELRIPFQVVLSRERLESALSKVATFARSLVGGEEQGLIITDVRQIVVFINPFAEEVTGWKLEETKGKELSEIFCPIQTPTADVQNYDNAGRVDGVKNGTVTHMLVTKYGKGIFVRYKSALVSDHDMLTIGLAVTFRDIAATAQAA